MSLPSIGPMLACGEEPLDVQERLMREPKKRRVRRGVPQTRIQGFGGPNLNEERRPPDRESQKSNLRRATASWSPLGPAENV